jgi:hypothetical protein
LGEGAEVGDGEHEGGIGPDRVPERRYRVRRARGLLRSAIEGGGSDVCRDRPPVVLDRWAGKGRFATAGGGIFWYSMHDDRFGLSPEVALK